jgi:hypothetical protein
LRVTIIEFKHRAELAANREAKKADPDTSVVFLLTQAVSIIESLIPADRTAFHDGLAVRAAELSTALNRIAELEATAAALTAENARLREALKDTDARLCNHHDYSYVRKLYEGGLGHSCELCLKEPQVFERNQAVLNTPATDAELDRIRHEAAAEELERLEKKLTTLDDAAQAINTRLFIGSALFLIQSRIEELRGKP